MPNLSNITNSETELSFLTDIADKVTDCIGDSDSSQNRNIVVYTALVQSLSTSIYLHRKTVTDKWSMYLNIRCLL